ncbi:37S ribosomal protein S24, mitochondrial [Tilletia horrida]|nr:37S ribosomal protein S24, mitochondrial [Tilletia horrida]KAK0548473.1 37S ribosomal protein S24, mitochondrial [Tilletia horrida]
MTLQVASRRAALAAGGASSSASSSSRAAVLPLPLLLLPAASASSSASSSARGFSTSTAAQAKPRKARVSADTPFQIRKLPAYQFDDISSLGHEILDYNREFLRMFRLVELELPKLAQFRQPFVPPSLSPSESSPRIVQLRFVHHQGDSHPENRKAVLTVDVGALFAHPSNPLPSKAAQHKFLLLAGERYNPQGGLKDARDRLRVENGRRVRAEASASTSTSSSPTGESESTPSWTGTELRHPEANLSDADEAQLQARWWGHVKIASDRFPNENMNAAWCLDTLKKLLVEANNAPEKMAQVPLDPRRQFSKEERAHPLARSHGPSLRDFPKEWL